MRHLHFLISISLVATASLFSGCTGRKFASESRHSGPLRADIVAVLDRQAQVWNLGDVEAFMAGYWNSSELSFSSGGNITRGYGPTLQRFLTKYPDKAAMGHLTFSDLEVTILSPDAALVLGRWRVDSSRPASGTFSLVMRRINGQWLIIHDHTSRDAS